MSNKLKHKKISFVQKNPKMTILIMIVTYFLLDYLMMDTKEILDIPLIVLFTLLAPLTLYSYYVNDYRKGLYPTGSTDVPKFIKDKKRYVTIGWFLILLWGITLLIAEPLIVPKFFPVIDTKYCQSQTMLMVFIAPVMEEVIFRYLLYDRLLKQKWGWFWGFVAASFIFVICHPVTNMHSLVIYWIPTVLFFLIYNEFGLYGSILMHMIYNMIAI